MHSAIVGQLRWLLEHTDAAAHRRLLAALKEGRMNGSLYYDEDEDCGCVLGHLAWADGSAGELADGLAVAISDGSAPGDGHYIEDEIFVWRPGETAYDNPDIAEMADAVAEWMRAHGEALT